MCASRPLSCLVLFPSFPLRTRRNTGNYLCLFYVYNFHTFFPSPSSSNLRFYIRAPPLRLPAYIITLFPFVFPNLPPSGRSSIPSAHSPAARSLQVCRTCGQKRLFRILSGQSLEPGAFAGFGSL